MLENTKKYIKNISEKLKNINTAIKEGDNFEDILLKLNIKKDIQASPIFEKREDAEKYQSSIEEQERIIFINSISSEIIETKIEKE